MRAGGESWSIDVLPEWEIKDHSECLSIYKPDGVGSLQLSSAKKIEGNVTQQDLGFHSKSEWGTPEQCIFGEFAGQLYKYVEDETFWYWWVLASGPVLLRATYNSEIPDRNIELAQIEQMLKTLKTE